MNEYYSKLPTIEVVRKGGKDSIFYPNAEVIVLESGYMIVYQEDYRTVHPLSEILRWQVIHPKL